MEGFANVRRIVGTNFGDDDDTFLALVALDSECNHVAGAHALEAAAGALDVLRKDVPAAHDDDVFDAPAQHQFAFDRPFGYALIDLAALSFLGLNVQPPTADWGVMVNNEAALLQGHPLQVFYPCLLIVLSVTAVTYLGNRLADSEDGRT